MCFLQWVVVFRELRLKTLCLNDTGGQEPSSDEPQGRPTFPFPSQVGQALAESPCQAVGRESLPEPTSHAQSGNTCLSVQSPPLAGEWEASVGPFPPAPHIVWAGRGGSQEGSADSWWPAGTVFRPENGNTRHSGSHLAQPQQSGRSHGIAAISEVRGFHSGNVGVLFPSYLPNTRR